MADDPAKPAGGGSWWSTIPGILTATAAVITAVTGLTAILVQNGVIGARKADVAVEKPVSSPAASLPATAERVDAMKQAAAPRAGDSIASGIASTRLEAVPFTGAVVTLRDRSTIKVRDMREWCHANAALVTTNGQTIEWERLKRFDVVDGSDGPWTVRVAFNNGETMEARVKPCSLRGANDLGEVSIEFANVRAVEFVR